MDPSQAVWPRQFGVVTSLPLCVGRASKVLSDQLSIGIQLARWAATHPPDFSYSPHRRLHGGMPSTGSTINTSPLSRRIGLDWRAMTRCIYTRRIDQPAGEVPDLQMVTRLAPVSLGRR